MAWTNLGSFGSFSNHLKKQVLLLSRWNEDNPYQQNALLLLVIHVYSDTANKNLEQVCFKSTLLVLPTHLGAGYQLRCPELTAFFSVLSTEHSFTRSHTSSMYLHALQLCFAISSLLNQVVPAWQLCLWAKCPYWLHYVTLDVSSTSPSNCVCCPLKTSVTSWVKCSDRYLTLSR